VKDEGRPGIARAPDAVPMVELHALPLVIAHLSDSEVVARLGDALSGEAVVMPSTDADALLAIVADLHPVVVAYELAGEHERSAVPALRRLLARTPGLAVVGYCRLGRYTAREAVEAARAGLCELALPGYNDLADVVRRFVSGGRVDVVVAPLLAELQPLLSAEARAVVEICFRYARRRLDVNDVARDRGVTARALARRLAVELMPPPGVLIQLSRMLLAAALLDQPSATTDGVAAALGYGSGSVLRRTFHRWTGLRASDARNGRAVARVFRLFQGQLESARRTASGEHESPLQRGA